MKMPTGLTNSPDPGLLNPTSIPTKKGAQPPAEAINITLTITLRVDDIPQVCPPYVVPLGASVNVRGQNGTADGNAASIFIANHPSALQNGNGRMITPDTEIFYPVDSTAQIWISGKAGDGAQVTITANPVG
jgi:hypothetical protein